MRMWMVIAVMVYVTVGHAGTAEAQYLNGNNLLRLCESDNQADQGMCVGYLMGIDDMTSTYDLWDEMTKRFCVPEDVPNSQLREVAIEGLPQALFPDSPAAGTIAIIFQRAFPCSRQGVDGN